MRLNLFRRLSCFISIVQLVAGDKETENVQVLFKQPSNVTSGSLQNIHIEYANPEFSGNLAMVFGECDLLDAENMHQIIGSTHIQRELQPTRFVWIVPDNTRSGGCLHAFSDSRLVGRSAPVEVKVQLRKRQSISEVADISGPWFDGVAYLNSKNNSDVFVAAAKSKS
jgi:hypothetical protein